MISVKINNLKDFTSKLFVKEVFDEMYLVSATIQTHSTFQIEGKTNEAFYSDTDALAVNEYTYWKLLRPICFEMIKGKQLPCYFKFVLKLTPVQMQELLASDSTWNVNDIAGLFLNIKYEQGCITLTTGTSLKIFTLDKGLEQLFDHYVTQFLEQNSIEYTIL